MALFQWFLTTVLLQKKLHGLISLQVVLAAPQGQVCQPSLAESEGLLHRKGAAELHIYPPDAHSDLRRHFQQLQPHATRRRPRQFGAI